MPAVLNFHNIFRLSGYGRGMGVPHFDGIFLWLSEGFQKPNGKHGNFYYVASKSVPILLSFETKAAPSWTKRWLNGNVFVVQTSRRKSFRCYEITWKPANGILSNGIDLTEGLRSMSDITPFINVNGFSESHYK